jgi:hypothetical protein
MRWLGAWDLHSIVQLLVRMVLMPSFQLLGGLDGG